MRLSITTPRGSLVDADVEEVTAPGVLGEFGILPGHIPFLSAVKPGVLVYRTKEGARLLAVGEGILEVASDEKNERVLVLVEQALTGKSIDREAAAKEVAQLDAELSHWKKDLGPEYQGTLSRRAWAAARLEAADRAQLH